jgi:hypothetical protein
MRDTTELAPWHAAFEFLSATSIVVVQQGALEVYDICMKTPGAPPVHTASFFMPPPNLDEYPSTIWIHRNSHVSHGIDDGNLSDCSSFPSSSFQLDEARFYLTVQYGPFGDILSARFYVPLSSLRRSPMYGDALAISWEVWSKDVYCLPESGIDY